MINVKIKANWRGAPNGKALVLKTRGCKSMQVRLLSSPHEI